jgi:polyribonucleotide nucleotidyltransferase
MLNITKQEFEIDGKQYYLETGKFANQADAAVVCGCGETQVLATAVFAKEAKSGVDFFPLTVNYVEKFYAFGKVPGGYIKRERGQSEREVLTSRLIDRPIRPMFPEGFCNEVQVICTLISYDKENDPEMIALIAAAAAIRLSGLPILHTIAGAKVAMINDKFVINPTNSELEASKSTLDLTIASTKSSIIMVESSAHELSEEQMLNALQAGKNASIIAIDAIEKLAEKTAKPKFEFVADNSKILKIEAEISNKFAQDIKSCYTIAKKQDRYAKKAALKNQVLEMFKDKISSSEMSEGEAKTALANVEYKTVREMILSDKKRIDGRSETDIREIYIEQSVLPRSHGSAMFCRGETQALVVATLGSEQDAQMSEGINGMHKEKFMLNYNFPPFSVGEVGALRAPGRREIGHGKLAQKAILPVLDMENSQYSIRIVSEILACNGSSSMATVCGTSLALMNAGVKIKKQIAGIAMGLIKENDKYSILTDIMGDEDHLGDMDFKVAGSRDGITALQMDIKIDGISDEILAKALDQAKEARIFLLDKMDAVIAAPSESISEFAPQVESFQVAQKLIGDIIGKGGATIKQFCEDFECKIDISDAGLVTIYAQGDNALKAKEAVLLSIQELEKGEIYDAVVIELKDFGAFVQLPGKKQGLLHISEIDSERVENISDYLSVNDQLKVKYLGVDDKRRIKLSAKGMGLVNRNKSETTAEEKDSNCAINRQLSSESEVEVLQGNSSFYSN